MISSPLTSVERKEGIVYSRFCRAAAFASDGAGVMVGFGGEAVVGDGFEEHPGCGDVSL